MRRSLIVGLVMLGSLSAAAPVRADGARLLRHPSVSDGHIVFAYANDVWIVDRAGGEARRLTTFPGSELHPHLSPDGTMVAFSGQYDGNTDVYVVPVEGGEPRRLTWHPGGDVVKGWTDDGAAVIFASGRDTAPVPYTRFWTIALDGAMPDPMPVPRITEGKLDVTGRRLAYQPIAHNDVEWRNYRGGQNRPVWVLDMETYDLTKLPWDGTRDTGPVWLNGMIYFISDRDFTDNIWRYNPGNGSLKQITKHTDFDAKHLEAGGGVLVYEHAGAIRMYDPEDGADAVVEITLRGDFPWARPHWESVGGQLQNGSLSPTGKRAVFEARGEIMTVPAKDGDARNLTRSPGTAERFPAWSPDGRHIAWFSDAGGEYRLMIGTQEGLEAPRAIEIPDPTFFYAPRWSPDGEHIVFTDEARRLHLLHVESGALTLVDADKYAVPGRSLSPVWSPCSRWIAYAKRLDNQLRAIMAYSLDSGESHQLTDGMSDAISPAFDRSGKHLYFLASTNAGLTTGWLDMSGYDKTVTLGVYMIVLADDVPSPLLPKSDEEPVAEDDQETVEDENGDADDDDADDDDDEGDDDDGDDEADDQDEEEPAPATRIDLDGIDQRILALPMPARNYVALAAAGEGVIFVAESSYELGAVGLALHRFSLEQREAKPFLAPIFSFATSHDGKKLLYGAPGGTWGIVDTAGSASVGKGRLATESLRMRVDPAAEWKQIFDEAWRLHRDYFYVENLHGADWDDVHDRYAPLVAHVRHRSDLTHLLDVMGGEIAVGHSFTGGGDTPDVDSVPIGLLGADFETANGRYRIKRILRGENWNPGLRAPLSQPGLDAREGDYLLAVDGVELDDTVNLYSAFERTANRQVHLH
ncbi:MAG: S41 family peptidase, partial [Planctomycetota bacterium]